MAGKKRQDFEAKEQIALFVWANMQPHPYLPGKVGDYLFAIPNGGYKLPIPLAVKFKRMGVKSGVSDVFLPNANTRYNGLWVEMKKQRKFFAYPSLVKRAESEEQKEWGEKMVMCGYQYKLCFGWEEASEEILTYLSGGG